MRFINKNFISSLFIDNQRFANRELIIQQGKKKILKSFLDLAILNEMQCRSAMSASDIIDFFSKNHSVYINPGTLYPILEKLEKQGYILKVANRSTRLFIITNVGKDILNSFQQIIGEIQLFLLELIQNKEINRT